MQLPRRRRTVVAGVVAIAVAAAGSAAAVVACTRSGSSAAAAPSLRAAGVLGSDTGCAAVDPRQAAGASYVADSDVLRLPDGRWRYLPDGGTTPLTVPAGDRGAAARVRADRAWLAAGSVPGVTAEQRAAAARALLALHALLRPNGAVAAACYGIWAYSWPRDASFVAVALARTGHLDDAYRVLLFNARTQLPDGTWNARTTLDGHGPPDARPWQLDADGWVPWSVYEWYESAGVADRARGLRALLPAVERAANYAAASLGGDALPPARPDYWESPTATANLGTAAPLLSGLRAAAVLATAADRRAAAARWTTAANRLSAAIQRTYAHAGYPRTATAGSGADTAITFLGPPFDTAPPDLTAALDRSWSRLRQADGGVIPGREPGKTWNTQWTPETALFALAWSGTGRPDRAARTIDWLLAHRDALGDFPEQVTMAGQPASVAPLAWTDALVTLTLAQLSGQAVPTP